MRVPLRSTIALLVCWLALNSQIRLAVAEGEASGSTIRLTSFTEPVRDNAVSASAPQEGGQHIDDAPPARADSQPVQSDVRTAAATVPATESTTIEQPPVRRPRMPAGFYASPSARETLAQMPRRVPVQPAPPMQQARRAGKPFQSIPMQPTLSPYLHLNAGSRDSSPIANYMAFVRPHDEQLEASRQQQQVIEELRTQVQQLSAASSGPQQSATRNSAARYMNTAQFYRGLQR